MKNLNKYILEKQNFLVKNHIKNNKIYNIYRSNVDLGYVVIKNEEELNSLFYDLNLTTIGGTTKEDLLHELKNANYYLGVYPEDKNKFNYVYIMKSKLTKNYKFIETISSNNLNYKYWVDNGF